MALLDILTPELIAERFYSLPQALQDALDSPDNRRAVQIACVMNGVGDPDELQNVEAIMAAVILGLTHMDDLGQTIAENIGLDLESSDKIAAEMRSKVLEPLREEIKKVYAPTGSPAAKPPAAPIAIPLAPISSTPKTATPAPPPSSMPISTGSGANKPPAPMTPLPSSPAWQPTRLAVPKVPPAQTIPAAAQPAPVRPAAATPPAPAPFMMHQEASAAPLAPGTDFKLNISKDMFKSAPNKPIDIPRPPKAAELEIGKAPVPPKPAGGGSVRIAPAQQSRVVHYTDMRSAVSPAFGIPQPAANVPPPVAEPAKPPAIQPGNMATPIPEPHPAPNPPAPIWPRATPPTPGPATPLPPKPPKVVNFGPEEVK